MLYTLVIVFNLGYGAAAVSIPHYQNIEVCHVAGKEAIKDDHYSTIKNTFCVVEPDLEPR
jgi:hypothetical protein